ncbi:MAG: hypothetical protein QXU20_01400 [Candidatus Woesearchaeota archaeon]
MIKILNDKNLKKELNSLFKFLNSLGIKNQDEILRKILDSEDHAKNKKILVMISNSDLNLSEVFLLEKEKFDLIENNFKDYKILSLGLKIGSLKNNFKNFIPSQRFLDLILRKTDFKLNYLIVNEKSEWLFICKRDIFKNGILNKNHVLGDKFLVLNSKRECIGIAGLKNKDSIIKNIFDIGDFLRREKFL